MKYLIAAIIAVSMLSFTAEADAGIFFNRTRLTQRNNGAGILPYWSPGAFRGLWSQNRGPRMVWRGDWVLR